MYCSRCKARYYVEYLDELDILYWGGECAKSQAEKTYAEAQREKARERYRRKKAEAAQEQQTGTAGETAPQSNTQTGR